MGYRTITDMSIMVGAIRKIITRLFPRYFFMEWTPLSAYPQGEARGPLLVLLTPDFYSPSTKAMLSINSSGVITPASRLCVPSPSTV